MEDFDSTHDSDGTLDDQYFYDHHGKQPVKRGSSGVGRCFILIIVGSIFIAAELYQIGIILFVIAFLYTIAIS